MAERAGTVSSEHVSAGTVHLPPILLSLRMRWAFIHDDLLWWQTVYNGRAGHEGAPRPCRRGALELCDVFSRGAVCQVLLTSTNTSTGCSSCCRQWMRRSGRS